MATDEKALSHNRSFDQIIHPNHHTLKTKWNHIRLQIFGYENAYENKLISIEHCYVINMDFYRLHKLERKKHLDPIKVYNPVKWIEFCLIAPLEMISFSLRRSLQLAAWKVEDSMESLNKKNKFFYLNYGLGWFALLLLWLGGAISILLDLAVNMTTGTLRRCLFLAPARYIIRPAIEMALNYPKSFACIFTLLMAGTGVILGMLLTGGLPVFIAHTSFLSLTLIQQLCLIAVGATWIGSAFTKGFNIIKDCALGINAWWTKPIDSLQVTKRYEREQIPPYDISIMSTQTEPTLETLKDSPIPLFIRYIDNSDHQTNYLYGLSATGKKTLKKLYSYFWVTSKLFKNYPANTQDLIELVHSNQIPKDIYEDIFQAKAHYILKTGSTKKITEALHNIDIKHAYIPPLETPDFYYYRNRFIRWIGAEAIIPPFLEENNAREDNKPQSLRGPG